VASRYAALKKSVDWGNYHLDMDSLQKSIMEDKGKMRRRGPTLVRTPKGTSHW